MNRLITVTQHGPYKVEEDVALAAAGGDAVGDGSTAFLCRCGQSQSKPFCDGSHWYAGFKDPA